MVIDSISNVSIESLAGFYLIEVSAVRRIIREHTQNLKLTKLSNTHLNRKNLWDLTISPTLSRSLSSTRETDLLLKILRSGLLINFDDLESLSHRMVREALVKDKKMSYKKMYIIESKASKPKKNIPASANERYYSSPLKLRN